MILSQLSIAPVGVGTSLHMFVRETIKVFKKHQIKFETNDMATVLETKDLDTLFLIVKEAHNAVIKKGASRVITELKIDERADKDVHLGDKKDTLNI